MKSASEATYFWHNLNKVYPSLEKYHYPFKIEYGTAPKYFNELVKQWVVGDTLELGCGTGWLAEEWEISSYTGVELGDFSAGFQKLPRARQMQANVLNISVGEVSSADLGSFDTVICYESLQAFPSEGKAIFESPLLRRGGHVIIVDALLWLPRGFEPSADRFRTVYRHEVPNKMIDFRAVARMCVDIIACWEERGMTRDEIKNAIAGYLDFDLNSGIMLPMPHERIITRSLMLGISIDRLRAAMETTDLEPKDFRYTVIVLEKV